MNIYEEFKTDILHVEGCVRHVYLEPISGKLHAGMGHLLTAADVQEFGHVLPAGTPVTQEQVDAWFDADYRVTLASAETHFPAFHEYPDIVQLAILNWLWQLGPGAPERFPNATAAIHECNWHRAAEEWLFADVFSRRWSRWRLQTQHRCEQEAHRLQFCKE